MSDGATTCAPASAWAQGLFHQNFDGFVVEDVAVRIGQPVLPVYGVGVEGDIGHDAEFGEFLAQGTHDGRYESFGVVGFFRQVGFISGNDGEERQHGDTELEGFFGGEQ